MGEKRPLMQKTSRQFRQTLHPEGGEAWPSIPEEFTAQRSLIAISTVRKVGEVTWQWRILTSTAWAGDQSQQQQWCHSKSVRPRRDVMQTAPDLWGLPINHIPMLSWSWETQGRNCWGVVYRNTWLALLRTAEGAKNKGGLRDSHHHDVLRTQGD